LSCLIFCFSESQLLLLIYIMITCS
jgi:hypothetical protein